MVILDTATFIILYQLFVTGIYDPLAQSAEHLPFKQGVARSNRARVTKVSGDIGFFRESYVATQLLI